MRSEPAIPTYTMGRTWPDDPGQPNDYVFRIDGRDAGRCYFMHAAGNRAVWLWTVYGSPKGGMEDTLEGAQRQFKAAIRVNINKEAANWAGRVKSQRLRFSEPLYVWLRLVWPEGLQRRPD